MVCAAAIALAVAFQSAIVPPATGADLRDLLPFGRAHRISRLLPAVVAITIHKTVTEKDTDTGSSESRAMEGFGSGFIIDPSGFIATNDHVIDGAADITVTLQDGTALPAKLIGVGDHIDLALLKVDPPKPLPAVKWGDSSKVRVGDQVLVIGNPLGIGETVSSGIVSALNRNILLGPYDDFIQTDAAINHGNSGGPMFNTRGDVIGVNTALLSPGGGSVGLGFAIPGNDAQYVLDQLKKFGRLKAGYLGAATQDVTPDMADALGLNPPHGTIIADVDKDSPAGHAKLQDGDVIVKFGEQTPRDMRALARLVAESTGDTVQLTVWRDGKAMTVPITITEWTQAAQAKESKAGTPAQAVTVQAPDLGLHTGPLTDDARTKHELAAAQPGLLVTAVTPNTVAAQHGLAAGDVILRVQEAAPTTPDDLKKQLDEARTDDRHHVLLLVAGSAGMRWVALPLS
jgi:serine protease Do